MNHVRLKNNQSHKKGFGLEGKLCTQKEKYPKTVHAIYGRDTL